MADNIYKMTAHAIIDDRIEKEDFATSQTKIGYELTLTEWVRGNAKFISEAFDEITSSYAMFDLVAGVLGRQFLRYLIGDEMFEKLDKEVRRNDQSRS